MLYEILVGLFTFLCILLIGLIFIQKAKSSLGVNSLNSSAQMLFGGSGGQDLMQKITWTFGAIFMAGSLTLAVMKKKTQTSKYKREVAAQEERSK